MHSSDGTNHFYVKFQRAGFEARYERSRENKTRSALKEIVASFVAGNSTVIFRNSIASFITALHRPCKCILVQATFGEMGRL
jgi:hypothetical protein